MKNRPSIYLSSYFLEKNTESIGVDWSLKFKQLLREQRFVRTLSNETFKQFKKESLPSTLGNIRKQGIAEATTTVVLLGPDTWKSQQVDWEISATTQKNATHDRCGLIGVFLPSHPDYGSDRYDPYTIPPRLYDNFKRRYAKLYNWTEDLGLIAKWLDISEMDKVKYFPDNTYPLYKKDLAVDQIYWLQH